MLAGIHTNQKNKINTKTSKSFKVQVFTSYEFCARENLVS